MDSNLAKHPQVDASNLEVIKLQVRRRCCRSGAYVRGGGGVYETEDSSNHDLLGVYSGVVRGYFCKGTC
jgi:hypothetical protein